MPDAQSPHPQGSPYPTPHRPHQHGGAHGHHHGEGDGDFDWAALGPVLERQAELYTPVYVQAADWLRERQPEPALIVDAGSGPGVIAGLFAEAFPGAGILAVDGEEALLERARNRAADKGFASRVRTLHADLPGGLDATLSADIIWAGNSLHHMGDQGAAVAALAERLAPGGVLALLEGGLKARFLPRDAGLGRPGLQSRMDAAEEESFARMRDELPDSKAVTEDWAALFKAAGLRSGGARSFLLDLPAPLSEAGRDMVVDYFERRRDMLGDSLTDDDRAALDRLLDPDDPAGLRLRPDVFVLGAHTVHTGVKDAG